MRNDQATTTDEQADRLVHDHLQLVQYVVSEVAQRLPGHVSRNDLVSAGMLGLVQAARSFEPERGIAFDRYASTRIRGALLDELRGRDWASRSVRSRAREMHAAVEAAAQRLGRAPSTEEIATEMRTTAEKVERIGGDVHRATVLNYDALVDEGDAESVLTIDETSAEDVVLERERRAYLADAVAVLPERLRYVVMAYFFEEKSMLEIADELGVSESRVSQLRTEALALLRDGMNSQLDPDALAAGPAVTGVRAKRRNAYYDSIAERAASRRAPARTTATV